MIHHAYYLALAYGYRFGDLSHVYPIARGVAPPLWRSIAWAFAGEAPGALGLVAILVISGGIVSLAFTDDGRLAALEAARLRARDRRHDRRLHAVRRPRRAQRRRCLRLHRLAVRDRCAAVRAAGRLALPRAARARRWRCAWRPAAIGGVLAAGAYGLVIWAMTRSPMAQVSALRETSVIMAALIGTRLLREPFGTRRIVAASLVAVGVVLLQVGRAV